MMFWVGDYILIKYVWIKNANIIHDTPAGLTENNFQTMDIDDFIRWAFTLYRFVQSKDIDSESLGYQVWRDVLAPVYFIGRQDKPWRTIFNRRRIWCGQISTQSSGTVWVAITFCWFTDQCQYRSLLLLGAKRKIPIVAKIFGFQSRYAGNFRER